MDSTKCLGLTETSSWYTQIFIKLNSKKNTDFAKNIIIANKLFTYLKHMVC